MSVYHFCVWITWSSAVGPLVPRCRPCSGPGPAWTPAGPGSLEHHPTQVTNNPFRHLTIGIHFKIVQKKTQIEHTKKLIFLQQINRGWTVFILFTSLYKKTWLKPLIYRCIEYPADRISGRIWSLAPRQENSSTRKRKCAVVYYGYWIRITKHDTGICTLYSVQ